MRVEMHSDSITRPLTLSLFTTSSARSSTERASAAVQGAGAMRARPERGLCVKAARACTSGEMYPVDDHVGAGVGGRRSVGRDAHGPPQAARENFVGCPPFLNFRN